MDGRVVKHKTPGHISREKIFCSIVTEDQYSLDLLHTFSVPSHVLHDSADAVKLDCALRQLFIITYLYTVFQNYTKFVSYQGSGAGAAGPGRTAENLIRMIIIYVF